jgi:3-methylfumaryl-CoA hydratase
MATLLLNLAASELGSNRLSRFSFRGQAPAFANDTLHLVGRREGQNIILAVLGMDGREIMMAQAAVEE